MSDKVVKARYELLRRQILGCRNCSLVFHCKSPVPATVPPPGVVPQLLVVGEAPGGQEDRAGEPFVGPAGQLLFKWLKIELGLSRQQCVVCNPVSCRPTVANNQKTNRAPSKVELKSCRDNLARQVDYYHHATTSVANRWVLLLGATALQAFLPEARVSWWAGKPFVMMREDGEMFRCLATYHPASALRDPGRIGPIRRHLNFLAALRKDVGGLWPDKCMCGKEVELYDEMGLGWCEAHRGMRKTVARVPRVKPKQTVLV